MLFEPDRESAEASEDIALWLADEFSQVCRYTIASILFARN